MRKWVEESLHVVFSPLTEHSMGTVTLPRMHCHSMDFCSQHGSRKRPSNRLLRIALLNLQAGRQWLFVELPTAIEGP